MFIYERENKLYKIFRIIELKQEQIIIPKLEDPIKIAKKVARNVGEGRWGRFK